MVTVLIADDSPVARHALRSRLQAAGADVVEAASAAEASVIDPHHVDAAILDLDLGDGDGVSLARVLLAKRPKLSIAFFTSDDGSALALEAAKIGTVFPKDHPDQATAWAVDGFNPT